MKRHRASYIERSESHVLEDESRLAFRNWLPKNWIPRNMNPDYGIDMEVQIAKGKKVTAKFLFFQIKATESIKQPHKSISCPIETRHLKHYEDLRLPIIILFWVKSENAFYYLFAQRFIKEELSAKDPKWRERETKTIEFPSSSRLKNAEALESIATDGYLYIAQQQLSASSSAVYWLDGIPKSDDKELKEGMLKAFSLMIKEKHQDAIAELERLLKVCTVSPTQRMSILLNLGNSHLSLSQDDKALSNYTAILELSKKVGKKDAVEGKASALGNIGIIYRNKGDLDSALKYNQEALKIDREIRYRQGEANQLGNIGLIYGDKGDLDKALWNFTEILKIHREIGDRQGEAADLGNIGLIYKVKGDLDKALENLQEALRIHREIGWRQGEANQLGNIGAVYQLKGDLDKALKHNQEALKIDREIGYRQGEATDLGNIGIIYKDKGDLDNALKYLKDALAILDRFRLVYGRDIFQKTIDSITKNTSHE